MRYLKLCLAALLISGTAAAEVPGVIAAAIDHTRALRSTDWSYVRTTDDDGSVVVEAYDASGGDARWTLLSIDGEAPSAKERARYAKDADERAERDHPGEVPIEELYDAATLEVLEETDDYALFAFRPLPEDEKDAKVMAFLDGRLRVDRRRGYVEWVELASSEPFSPNAVVKIERMRMRMEFAPPSAERPSFLRRIASEIDGRLAGLKKVHERESVEFHDFERRAATP